MDEIREVRYLTDDRDERRRNELVINFGGNGDWYVAVVPEGEGAIGRSVRICTSGGASSKAPGLGVAIADAFRALVRVLEQEAEQEAQNPKCDISGRCVAPKGASGITSCKFCGKELVQHGGKWYTHDAFLSPYPTPQDQE